MPERTERVSLQPVVKNYNYFSLSISPSASECAMLLQMTTPIFHTCDIPATHTVLRRLLPTIFRSSCFNENKYSFTKEVKNTEIGHLFEHILLEYLCLEKLQQGYPDAVFNGVTHWNWIEEPAGTFHIVIDAAKQDREIFYPALERSIQLFIFILETKLRKNEEYN